MSNLLKFEDAANELGVGINNLYVQAVNKPIWYVKRYGVSYVDMKLFTRQRVLTAKCYEANTSELYWLMSIIFKTDKAMCEWMAERSVKYKNATSWRHFLSVMFSTTINNGVELRHTMQADFFVLSIIAITIAKRKGVEFGSYY